MLRKLLIYCFCIFILTACASTTASQSPGSAGEAHTAPQGPLFANSSNCTACHTNMEDESGKNVSTDGFWRASLMANSARDPYWLATVRSEVTLVPEHRETIEKTCATCHTPMAQVTAAAEGSPERLLDGGFLDSSHALNTLALDGDSCTVCHQIEKDNFGKPESFSGGFQIDTQTPSGERLIYGPYKIDSALSKQMQTGSGFLPQQSKHMAESELCGTCHDLRTPFLNEQDQVAGVFPEQMIYSEWENSDYKKSHSCQDCHMPLAQGGVKLAVTGGPLRSPFYQHIFVGGNTFMLQMLQQNGDALATIATHAQFETMIAATRQQMETQTATIQLEQLVVQEGMLTAQLAIRNLVGHKFPGGYPSRRVWLHITVLDGAGSVVFESGGYDADGRIPGNDNDEDATRFEPHFTMLSTPDQVQIYEAIMVNSVGKVTTNLLHGAAYAKDNRLLPQGFNLKANNPEISVYGTATLDDNFAPGADELALEINLDQAQGPFTLQVELLYQAIGYRWADNLRTQTGAEIQAFADYYASTPNLPIRVAKAEELVSP